LLRTSGSRTSKLNFNKFSKIVLGETSVIPFNYAPKLINYTNNKVIEQGGRIFSLGDGWGGEKN